MVACKKGQSERWADPFKNNDLGNKSYSLIEGPGPKYVNFLHFLTVFENWHALCKFDSNQQQGGSNENFNDQYGSYFRIQCLDQECYLGNFGCGNFGYFAWINELVK